MSTLAAIERDGLIIACAISAGIHAALTPEHFDEGAAGLGFLVATAALAAAVVALTRRPASAKVPAAAAVVLASLLASYAVASTTGLPLLHPEPEPLDGLALATKAIEAVGLLAATHLLWRGRAAVAATPLRPKGRLT